MSELAEDRGTAVSGEGKFKEILRQYWGFADFRGIQREIIESIAAGRDTLGLMPTGGGKSITFQVPALAMEGVCVVVTPLIALMKDQVQHLRAKGIKASAIYSGMSRAEIIKTLENAVFGGVKLLYVSPERLSSDIFQAKLKHINVSFITVDEAHCISQWGYDFRPSYLKIAAIRSMKPAAPVLALTATATPVVVKDIQEKLNFERPNVFQMSFERKNLSYVVRLATDKQGELVHILQCVPGSAIVYARSRRRCKDMAEMLERCGLPATYYHAGLDPSVKDLRQQQWQTGEKRVMVATNAFGMGIDKPDVRVVAHVDCPDSIEAYFQEAGRAGRDGEKAYAVLLWNGNDKKKLLKRIEDNFPPKEYIKDVYEHLAYYLQIGVGSGRGHTFSFSIDKFCIIYKYFPLTVDSALRILQNAGYLTYETDPDASARLMFLLGRNELYRLQEVTPREEAVITSVLRNYGGVFTDYAYIDLALVAHKAGVGEQEAYQILKSLSARHILHFIPQRREPYITYTQDRVDEQDLILPKEVYETRKKLFARRIDALLQYITEDGVCRSRMLLRYFGEMATKDCGVCDVCLEQRHNALDTKGFRAAQDAIVSLLGDKQWHDVRDFYAIRLPKQQIDDALEYLAKEEKVNVDANRVSLASN